MRFGRHRFFDSPPGKLLQRQKRKRIMFSFWLSGIEPRQKSSMPEGDKIEIQRQLSEMMARAGRRPFRGPVAMRLRIHTTARNPTHSHHIAKNLLDLFGKTMVGLSRSILYHDDQQVHALSVVCTHGGEARADNDAVEKYATIAGDIRPLRHLLEDLAIGMEVEQAREESDAMSDEMDFEHVIEHYIGVRKDKLFYTSVMDDASYAHYLRSAQQRAQELYLSRHRLTVRDLHRLFQQREPGPKNIDIADLWERVFAMSPLRIKLSELPQEKDSSKIWKTEIERKLKQFQAKHDWLFSPMLTPVALEVVIRPPAPSRIKALHDLDNVLRTYLMPKILEILQPISDHAFTVDFDALARRLNAPDVPASFAEWVRARNTPPASTRIGVIRYDAWRLPPAADGEKGFVSVALVPDMTGHNGVTQRLDRDLEDWEEVVKNGDSLRSIRRRY